MIEKMDKERYNLLKWFAVGWVLLFGAIILGGISQSQWAIVVLGVSGFFGWMLFVWSLIRFLRLARKIKSDSKLKDALDNELDQHYKHKAMTWGFWTMLASLAGFIAIGAFYPLSGLLTGQVTLFLGVAAALGASLYYQKN